MNIVAARSIFSPMKGLPMSIRYSSHIALLTLLADFSATLGQSAPNIHAGNVGGINHLDSRWYWNLSNPSIPPIKRFELPNPKGFVPTPSPDEAYDYLRQMRGDAAAKRDTFMLPPHDCYRFFNTVNGVPEDQLKLRSFKTLLVPMQIDALLGIITLDSPRLERIEVYGSSAASWAKVESDLNALAETDAAAFRTARERLSRVPVFNLNLEWQANPILSQREFDEMVRIVSNSWLITGLNIGVWPYDNKRCPPKGPGPVDLRSMAKLGNVKSLELTVEAISKISVTFPINLDRLIIREMGASNGSMNHVRLPQTLRHLEVWSDDANTRDALSKLAKSIGEVRITAQPLPYQVSYASMNWRLTGTWQRIGSDGQPGRTVDIYDNQFISTEPLLPGYRTSALLSHLNLTLSHIGPERGPNISREIGQFHATLEIEGDELDIVVPTSDYANTFGDFEKAAKDALCGRWRRLSFDPPYVPQTVVDDSQDKSRLEASKKGDGARVVNYALLATGVIFVLAAGGWMVVYRGPQTRRPMRGLMIALVGGGLGVAILAGRNLSSDRSNETPQSTQAEQSTLQLKPALDVDQLIANWDNASPAEKTEILAKLKALKVEARPALDLMRRVLKEPNPDHKVLAACICGQLGPNASAAVPELGLLIDADNLEWEVRFAAFEALWKIGAASRPLARQVFEIVMKKGESHFPAPGISGFLALHRDELVQILLEGIDEKSNAVFHDKLEPFSNDEWASHSRYIFAMGIETRIGHSHFPELPKVFLAYLMKSNPNKAAYRIWCIENLATLGPVPESAAPIIVEMIESNRGGLLSVPYDTQPNTFGFMDARRHYPVLSALRGMGPTGVRILVELLKSKRAEVSEAAFISTFQNGLPSDIALRDALFDCLKNESLSVRRHAASALRQMVDHCKINGGHIGSYAKDWKFFEERVPDVAGVHFVDMDDRVRNDTLHALGDIGEKAIPVLEKGLTSESEEVRARAKNAMKYIQAIPAFEKDLRSESEEVRERARVANQRYFRIPPTQN